MNECLLMSTVEFDAQQTQVVRQIGRQALEIAEYRYGSGFPDYRGGGLRELGFNNARHDQKVGDETVRLGEQVGLGADERELGRTTGYAHDIRQLKGRGIDEAESAEWIYEQMRLRGLPDAAASLASVAIAGTEPLFKDGVIIGQRVNEMQFESSRHELFAKTVVSADMGELYVPIGPYLGHKLYVQRQGLHADDTPQLNGLLEFQTGQITLLETYQYPLAEAFNVFATHRSQVINYAHYIYRQLQQGEIITWQQLIASDLDFMRNPDKRFC